MPNYWVVVGVGCVVLGVIAVWRLLWLWIAGKFLRNVLSDVKDYGGGDLRRDRILSFWFVSRRRYKN